MNFSIEVAAEANPLKPDTLHNILRSASSSNPQQVRTSALQLQGWETERGYYGLLQDVYLDKTAPLDIRYLSIIQLKNGVDKYWRKTAINVVHKTDKARIRSRLLESGVNEADHRLALQNALVIAKVVRFDYPNDWPEVIKDVVGLLNATPSGAPASRLQRSRALLILLHIVKELSTARLQRSRVTLQSASPLIVNTLGQLYVDTVRRWCTFFTSGGDDEGGALDDVEQSLLALRVLRRLVISGYEFPNRDEDLRGFWSLTKNQFGDFLSMTTQEPRQLDTGVQNLIEKHILQFSKLHLETSKTHPAAFVLLPGSVDLIRAYWGLIVNFGRSLGTTTFEPLTTVSQFADAENPEMSLMEKVCLKGLLILRASIKMVFNPQQTFKYRRPEDKLEQKEAVELVKNALLTETFALEIMEIIVTKFFVLRDVDLRDWSEDAEEWERREDADGDGWEFSIRPCSEKLFMDLMINFKDVLIQPLLQVFHTVSSPGQDNILLKDSVYTALALSAPVVHPYLDFDAFLNSVIVTDVRKELPGSNIIRRCVAILIGQWVSIKISVDNRPLVYQIFQHLLDERDSFNDDVVRITAAKQFKNVAEDWEFSGSAFQPYASDILRGIIALIRDVSLTETKIVLLNTISAIVERMERLVSPFAEGILAILPKLWDDSGEESLVKQAILALVTRLVISLKEQSQAYQAAVISLVEHAINPNSQSQVSLLEDSLELWAALLVQTPAPVPPPLLLLAQYLFPIYELGNENLRKALEITESYILLAPGDILSDQLRPRLFKAFATLLGNIRSEANGIVTHVVEFILIAADNIGGENALTVVGNDVIDSGFMTKLLNGLRGSWEARQTTGPNKRYPLIDGIIETDYFSVLARLVLTSPSVFLAVVEAASRNLSQTMDWLLDEWFSYFTNIAHPATRKLNCLALTKLLETSQAWILGRLQDLMAIWTDVITELREDAEDKGGDSLVWWATDRVSDGTETPEDARRQAMKYADPIHKFNSSDFIKSHFQSAMIENGGQELFQQEWLSSIDVDVIRSFENLGII